MAIMQLCARIPSRGRWVSVGNGRGQATIEFTLIVPILLVLMTGLLSFGIALHNFLVLTYGVNAGAQLLAISRGQYYRPMRHGLLGDPNCSPQSQFQYFAQLCD